MNLPVRTGDEAKAELDQLREEDEDALRELLGLIVKVKQNPKFGEALEDHLETGDLSDCRKLYFDKTRKRAVYQVHPNEQSPQEIRLIVVGARADLEVYHEAVRRLGRTPGGDAPMG